MVPFGVVLSCNANLTTSNVTSVQIYWEGSLINHDHCAIFGRQIHWYKPFDSGRYSEDKPSRDNFPTCSTQTLQARCFWLGSYTQSKTPDDEFSLDFCLPWRLSPKTGMQMVGLPVEPTALVVTFAPPMLKSSCPTSKRCLHAYWNRERGTGQDIRK